MVRVGLLTRLSCVRAGIKYTLFCFVFLFIFCCVNWIYVVFWKKWEASRSVYNKQNIVNLLHNIMGAFFSHISTFASSGFLRECFQHLLVSISLILHFSWSSPLPHSALLHVLSFGGEVHLLQHPPKEFQGGFLSLWLWLSINANYRRPSA